MSSVEDKIKELLEATLHEAKDAEDLGPAVDNPEAKSGPDGSKKTKKAAAPGGEGEKGDQAPQKVKEEEETDEEAVTEEEVVAEEESEEIEEAKTVAKEEEDEDEDESDDEEDDSEVEEMKKKIMASVDKMDMKALKASYNYVKSSYHQKEDVDMSEDVAALTEGEEFSEDFKAKAKTVFEAAVGAKVATKIVELEEHYEAQITEEVAKVKEDLTEKVDTYLSYVVEQWTADNELAIERGLKTEITEDFILGMKKLFEEHYVEVPEEKYDVMAEQQEKINELESKLNEQIEANAETMKIVNDAKKAIVLEGTASDLTDTQKEKFMSLAESVEFSDETQFAKELETLKESYFPKVAKPIEEDQVAVEEEVSTVSLSSEMNDYVSAISRTSAK